MTCFIPIRRFWTATQRCHSLISGSVFRRSFHTPILFSRSRFRPLNPLCSLLKSTAADGPYYVDRDGYSRFQGSYQGNDPNKPSTHPRRYLLIAIVLGGATYYVYHLEPVPISGRSRFMNIGESAEMQLGKMTYESTISSVGRHILPDNHQLTRYVKKVSTRLMAAVDQFPELKQSRFTVHVVDSPTVNAFVLPGILPVTENEDGLATVLSHELAHKLLRHHAERLSMWSVLSFVSFSLQLLLGQQTIPWVNDLLLQVGVLLPNSRKTETEADQIGLYLMAAACYDPEEAIGFWERMNKVSSKQSSSVAFLSTHPHPGDRMEKIKEWLPEAKRKREAAGCPPGMSKNSWRGSGFFS